MPLAAVDGLEGSRRLWAMAAIVIAVGMATLDTAIANVALPTIAADLDASPAGAVWIVNAYQLAMVATILPLASLGEIIGHKRVYVVGLVLFTLASLVCGLAWSLPSLAAARLFQGLGASAIMSVNAALISFIYPKRLLGRGLGINALVVALAFAIGPTATSAILSLATWPWLFIVNVPLGILGLALAWSSLPDTHRRAHDYDGKAALYTAGALGGLTFVIGAAAQREPAGLILAVLAMAAGSALLLVRRQAAHPAPMLPFDLFRRPVFGLSAATSVCSFAAQGLAFVALPFLFEVTMRRSQIESGFLMTPWPVVLALISPLAGRLSDRYPAGLLAGLGLAGLGLGLVSLALLPAQPDTAQIAWRLAACGAGFGLFQAPNLRSIMVGVPAGRAGSASGIVATGRLLGQTIGAALVAACFNVAGQHGAVVALGLGGVFAGAGSLASFSRLFWSQPQPQSSGSGG